MIRLFAAIAAISTTVAPPAFAQDADAAVATAPPEAPYQKVSELVKLPDFLPGIGEIFADPASLQAGPFVAYDHDGNLVSTIYMIPIKDMNADKSFDDLMAPGGNVDHVDIYFNAGHPGVEVPHEHIVL